MNSYRWDRDSDSSDSDINQDESLHSIIVERRKVRTRRYEKWHEKFLSYDEILAYLLKLQRQYKHKISIEHLCFSKEKRPILLIKIVNPKKRQGMNVMVEAGSNGTERMTVCSTLYLIEYLVKSSPSLLMEFLIVPCLNPDAYETNHQKGTPKTDIREVNIDFSKAFPIDATVKPMIPFLFKSYSVPLFVEPACKALLGVIEKYKGTIKLYISVQASDDTLTYPIENFFKDILNFALVCKEAMGRTDIQIKPIVNAENAKYGTVVEYIKRNVNNFIKFAYILNIHGPSFKPNEKCILDKGEEMLKGIECLIRKVYKFHMKDRRKRYFVKSTENKVP